MLEEKEPFKDTSFLKLNFFIFSTVVHISASDRTYFALLCHAALLRSMIHVRQTLRTRTYDRQ